MRSAAIYRHGGKIIIHPWSKTNTGVLLAANPFVMHPFDVEDEELGKALLSALEAVQFNLPHPTDWSAIRQSFLQAVGSRSWSLFMKNTVSCVVTDDGKKISILPQINKGSRDGFQPGDVEPLMLSTPVGADLLGASLKKGLASAR